jgi:pilus assembly protein CpaC
MQTRSAPFSTLLKVMALVCAVSAAVPAGARAEAVLPVSDEQLVNVEINKGAMVKLSRPAASVVIADPNTADVQVVSPKLVVVRGKKVGETSFYAIDAQDEPIVNATINVTHNISTLERTVKRIAPNADIGFKTVDGGLVMDGTAGTVAESEDIRNVASAFIGSSEKMVNMIRTAGSDQVMLRVKIVEMSRNDLKKLGINLQNVITRGGMSFQLLNGNDIAFSGGILDRSGSVDGNLYGNFQRGGMNLGGLIDALETQGLASVLAEPSLTTTSGKAASFLAGGQFPLPVKDQNNAVTIEYKPFGVSLNFTPVVMSKDRISITVAPEVSTLNFDNPIQVAGITYPILNTRQASAVVELGSGDSFAMAGLLKNEISNNVNKFPGLGEVPVLGQLFRSTNFQNNITELVILVTPYIVHPVAAQKLQTPLDGFVPTSDLQRVLMGDLYRQQPMTEEEKSSMPKLHGDGGFILE